MYDEKMHEFCSEFYSFVDATQVVVSIKGEQRHVKIEIWKDEKNSQYAAHVSIRMKCKAHGHSTEVEHGGVIAGADVWAAFPGFPWVLQDNAKIAFSQAMGFLRERVDKS